MERSGNFYKAIRLGYILISILIGCMAYNSLYEWQEIEALELSCFIFYFSRIRFESGPECCFC